MYLSSHEMAEVRSATRAEVRREFGELEMMARAPGSFHFLCQVGGVSFLSHTPVGDVICPVYPQVHPDEPGES